MNDPDPVYISRIIDHTTATATLRGRLSLSSRKPYWKQQQQESISLKKHRRDLYNFVKNHYTYDKKTGRISKYPCKCIHPDNCSLWLHHPNLDDAIVEFVESHKIKSDDGRSTTQRNSDIDRWLQHCYDNTTTFHHLS